MSVPPSADNQQAELERQLNVILAEYNLGEKLAKLYRPADLQLLLSEPRAMKAKRQLMELIMKAEGCR